MTEPSKPSYAQDCKNQSFIITLDFELDTDADEDQLATLLKLTERYCVILQTLRRGQEVRSSVSAG